MDEEDATFSNKVIDEVKTFIAILTTTVMRFYLRCIPPSDMDAIKEDLVRVLTSKTLNDQKVYKIVIIMCRIETLG